MNVSMPLSFFSEAWAIVWSCAVYAVSLLDLYVRQDGFFASWSKINVFASGLLELAFLPEPRIELSHAWKDTCRSLKRLASLNT